MRPLVRIRRQIVEFVRALAIVARDPLVTLHARHLYSGLAFYQVAQRHVRIAHGDATDGC